MDKFKHYLFKRRIQYIALISVCLIIYTIVQKLPQDLKISFIDQTTPNMIQRISGVFERKPLISRGIIAFSKL